MISPLSFCVYALCLFKRLYRKPVLSACNFVTSIIIRAPCICLYLCVCFYVYRTEPLVFGQSKHAIITGMIMGHWEFKQISSNFCLFLEFLIHGWPLQ